MNTIAASTRLPGLDTLRAFAVLVVMLYHLSIFGELPKSLLPVTAYGWMGVDLFFVLSGFLIGQQVLKPYWQGLRPSIADFYRRRAYRILPAYFVVLALYVFVPAWREAPQLGPPWKFATFTMNFGFSFSRRAFSHAWSLCVEEHFYLFLPLLVVWAMRHPSAHKTAALFAAFVLFGIGVRAFLMTHMPESGYWPSIYYPSYTRLDGLITGVALAVVRTFRPTWWHALVQRGHAMLLTGTALVALVIWMFRGDSMGSTAGSAFWGTIFGFPLFSWGLGLIVASSVSDNGLLARVKIPGAQLIATLAFSLYLTHKAVGHLTMQLFPKITVPQGPASWLLYAITCLATALLLHFAVERPFLRLRDYAIGRKPAAALKTEMRDKPAL